MEHLPALGTAIPDIISSTTKIYQPLLIEKANDILSTKKETFSYGPTPRQVLDIYYPSEEKISPSPVLLFFYGGGLVRGDRILSVVNGLLYTNLGHFFSKLGYVTVIPDYRLVPEAKYPSGGEDVLAALEWTDARFAGEGRDIYLMGNSAGGVHVSTFLLAENFASQRSGFIRTVGGLRGAILLSVPFSFREAHEERTETLQAYFGPDVERNSPLGLLKVVGKSGTTLPIPFLVLTCTLDPASEIINPAKEFAELCTKLTSTGVGSRIFETRVIEGHNHISPVYGVGTGKKSEEVWAVEVHEWMRTLATRK